MANMSDGSPESALICGANPAKLLGAWGRVAFPLAVACLDRGPAMLALSAPAACQPEASHGIVCNECGVGHMFVWRCFVIGLWICRFKFAMVVVTAIGHACGGVVRIYAELGGSCFRSATAGSTQGQLFIIQPRFPDPTRSHQ